MIELPGASDDLRELAARGVQHGYAKGRLLIEEGDEAYTMYIVISGRLRVFSAHPVNGRELTYGTFGPGDYVGEMSLDGGPRSASVETLERTVCAAVTRQTLEAFIAERPAFAFELLAKVIRSARRATLTARQLALNDAYGNLKAWLEAESVACADGSSLAGAAAHAPRPGDPHRAFARDGEPAAEGSGDGGLRGRRGAWLATAQGVARALVAPATRGCAR